jgi:ferric-dicitrate binding protein FerR (iron transport regulator)
MADLSDIPQDLSELLSEIFDGSAGVETQRRLAKRIGNDPKALQLYVRLVQVDVLLRRANQAAGQMGDEFSLGQSAASAARGFHRGSLPDAMIRPAPTDEAGVDERTPEDLESFDAGFDPADKSMHESMQMPALHDEPADADAAVMNSPPTTRVSVTPVRASFRRMKWMGIAAAVLLGTVIIWHFAMPPRPTAATITAEVGALWEGRTHLPGSGLSANDSLFLEQGFSKLLFADGTEVVVEGPSRVTIESGSALHLEQGTISARMISGSAGFVVTTPNAIVTDLGTEFGVKFDPAKGDCEVDVFKGKVRVAPGAADSTTDQTELSANQSAQVVAGAVKLNPEGARPQAYVRNLQETNSALDLADLVCGGDGTTRRTGTAIEPATGESGQLAPIAGHDGDGQYHRILSTPILDGCFIPEDGETQVDSAGHMASLKVPQEGTFDRIFAGGIIPSVDVKPIPAELGGVDYSSAAHRLLFIHPSAGLTFNLNAIRRLHPSVRLNGLHAVVGNSNNDPGASRRQPRLMILLDGKPVFDQVFKNHSEIAQLDVPVGDSDNFLTIVAIASDPEINFQDIIFGDPVLEISSSSN